MSSLNPTPLYREPVSIQRALISVSDKQGLPDLARALDRMGVEVISTGGTARNLREAGLQVTDISELTGFPEVLDGRVKTLHPHVHAALLARTSLEQDRQTLQQLGITPIDLVVVNLYPFRETIEKPDTDLSTAVENIDIGGPTLIRAAAKNAGHVCVLTDPGQYPAFIQELEDNRGQIAFSTRMNLSRRAFNHTAEYDGHIAGYFNEQGEQRPPEQLNINLRTSSELRYGENPHQAAALYGHQQRYIDCFHGKQLSYNNYLDIDAALELIADFQHDRPTCAIFKHTIPCGAATAGTLEEAWHAAFATDTVSPFGGIVVCNTTLDEPAARAIDEIFTEIIIAPDFDRKAEELLQEKSNRRLIRIRAFPGRDRLYRFQTILGGALAQENDRILWTDDALKVVTRRSPGEQQWADLSFAWRISRHVKSNAIVFARDGRTLGIGSGQPSRLDSSEIAVRKAEKAGLDLSGSVVASDAFFPFADGVETAAKAGAAAVVQPGGSVRDEEVIQAADRHDLAMLFTGRRHFRH